MNILATYTSDVNGLTVTLTDGSVQSFSYPAPAATPSEVDLSAGQTVTIKAV